MRLLIQLAAVLSLGLATPAFAQSSSPAAAPPACANGQTSTASAPCTPAPSSDQSTAAAASNSGAGTIVVTARKTTEAVRDIPATINAVSQAQIAATGPLIGTQDLLRTVPGVRFNNLQAPNLSEISIRGSGTERATGADSGVGLFVNGAYVGSSTLGGRNFKNVDFFDLDRVEVLEGPQGALYGRNAEFGVVNLVSAKPVFSDTGFASNTYTAYLQQDQLIGVVNYVLSDDVAVRLGAEAMGQSKGFYFNPDNNEYYDKTQGWIARAQIRYRHGPWDIDLLADAQDMNLPAFVSGFQIAPGVSAAVPLGFTNDRFTVPSSGLNSTEQQVQRIQLLGSLDLGWGQLSSTTMVTHSNSLQYFGSSIDLTEEGQLQKLGEIGAYPLSQTHTGALDTTYYEDLHLSGKAMDGALSWLVGGEYMDQHDTNLLTIASNPCTLTAKTSICGGQPGALICYAVMPADTACPATYPLAFGSVSNTPQHYQSEAAYGSLTYKIQRFTLSGEVRYTNDDKVATVVSTALYTGLTTTPTTTHEFTGAKPSFTLTASYKLPTPWDDMLYAKTGTGYRSGGVNPGSPLAAEPVPFQSTYGDEDTVSYEAGFKGNLGPDLFLTLDGYFSRTGNAITSVNDGCTLINVCGRAQEIFNINGGTVHAYGVEANLAGRFDLFGGKLNADVAAGWQHATFVAVGGAAATALPVVGSSVAQLPVWTESASIDYYHSITENLAGFVHAVYTGQSGGGQDTVTPLAPFVPLSEINDVALRTGLDYRKLEAAVFVQNLTDESLRLLILQTAGVTTSVRWNQPRTVGINLTYKW
ncbi:MAG TPA: TonB-dependent receptor [Caulobacteraceae bacterium]|jgi:iron complex outermembrane receptor protein